MIELYTLDEAILFNYQLKIEDLSFNKTNEDFFNSGSEHAVIVLRAIAKYAKYNIRVLAGNLCTNMSSDTEYLSHLRKFLMSGGKMQVLLCDYENGNDHKSKDIYKLFYEFCDNVILKTTNCVIRIQSEDPVHFTVADSRMYRLENKITTKGARGNFNDEKFSNILETTFDTLFYSPKCEIINS